LLLGLGFAVLVVGVIGDSSSILARHFRLFFLGICVVLNLTFMQGYFLDSLKQKEFIAEIRDYKVLAKSKVLMIDDQAIRFNARGRGIRNYEWDAMLSVAYPQLHLKSTFWDMLIAKVISFLTLWLRLLQEKVDSWPHFLEILGFRWKLCI
jgi:hypothetical protein